MLRKGLILMVAGLVLAALSAPAMAAWPEKTIELVVPWKAGGGSDIMGRFIAKTIKDHQLCSQPVVIINKPGGEGQIGSAYVINKKGDPYTWMTLSSGQISIPLSGMGSIFATDFVPLAQLAADTNFLVVAKDSPFKSVADVVKAAKANPEGVNIGGTAKASEDHICVYLLEKAAKIKLNYVAFSGGSEVMSNLLGGHVDAAWANPNECMNQVRGGLARLLAVTTDERLENRNDVPTFKELGYNFTFYQVRGVHGAPGMPKEAIEGSIDILRKAAATDTWKKGYIEPNLLQPKFIAGAEYTKVIKENEEMFKEALKAMGVYKVMK